VYLCKRQPERCRNAVKHAGSASGARIPPRKLDVSNYEEVNYWIENTVKEFGRLDGAANVAGIARVKCVQSYNKPVLE
jgi:NAD(P)-dependent dehydrogenase (short-subunit alcohol dehydrogenase family)